MKKKIILTFIIILITGIIIGISTLISNNNKSKNIELNINYKALIGIKVKSDIIIVINEKNKVSNILYLNEDSTKSIANQKIERKELTKAIELIIDRLKNNNEFNNNEILYLTNYGDNSIYETILEEVNKQFVVYGINNQIKEESSTISFKINELKLENSSKELENIKQLDKYSKKLLKE